MKNKQPLVKKKIIDQLTKGPLNYTVLSMKLKPICSDRTFRKALRSLFDEKIITKTRSSTDKRGTYSIKGIQLENTLNNIQRYDKALYGLETALFDQLKQFLEYSNLDPDSSSLGKHRLNLARGISSLMSGVLDLNNTIFFLNFASQIAMLSKINKIYTRHLKIVNWLLRSLKKHDKEVYKKTMELFVIESAPGLI